MSPQTNDANVRLSVHPYLGIAIGLAAVSTASVLIRYAHKDAPSLSIAAYRQSLASLLLAPLALTRYRDEIARLTRTDTALVIISGLFLGLHFATWISSLAYTSVAASSVLVATNPLFVAIFSPLWLHESVTRSTWVGIALTCIGSAIIGFGDANKGEMPLLGDGLALAGAVAGAGYLSIGRKIRPRLSLVSYIFVVYSVAALSLLTVAALARQPFTGFPPRTYLFFLALAIVPQLIGHSSFNWALRYLPATFIAITALGEPIGSTLLAWMILQESPQTLQVFGGALVLGGIFVVSCAK